MGILKKIKNKWRYREDRKLLYKVDDTVDFIFNEFLKLDFKIDTLTGYYHVLSYKNLTLKYWKGSTEFSSNSIAAYGVLSKNNKEMFSWEKCHPHYQTILGIKKALRNKEKITVGRLLIDVFAEHHVIPDNLENNTKNDTE